MRRRLTAAIVLAGFSVLSVPAPTAAADPTLDGMYTAEGVNPDGSPFRGVVKIVRRGESFMVAWLIPALVEEDIVLVAHSAGVGVASGDVLAVSYYGQDLTGVILYRIENGGRRLSGQWVSANGDGTIHSETLTKLVMPAATPGTGTPVPPPSKTPSSVSDRGRLVVRR